MKIVEASSQKLATFVVVFLLCYFWVFFVILFINIPKVAPFPGPPSLSSSHTHTLWKDAPPPANPPPFHPTNIPLPWGIKFPQD